MKQKKITVRSVSKQTIINEFVKRGYTEDEVNESLERMSACGFIDIGIDQDKKQD